MKLAEEQLEQCRTEFEVKFADRVDMFNFSSVYVDGSYADIILQSWWEGFQAAWRPTPTIEQIDKIINDHVYAVHDWSSEESRIEDTVRAAEAIHRVMGGNNG